MFNIKDYKISDSFPKLADMMMPNNSNIDNLKKLHTTIVEPIKHRWGNLRFLSAFRNKLLNAKVGGVKFSDHLEGMALDFYRPESNTKAIYDWIKDSSIPYRQLIYYKKKNFIHISINNPSLRKIKHEAFTK